MQWGGLQRTMVACPLADGKGMHFINPGRAGNKCWVFRDDNSLDLCCYVPDTLRWGFVMNKCPQSGGWEILTMPAVGL